MNLQKALSVLLENDLIAEQNNPKIENDKIVISWIVNGRPTTQNEIFEIADCFEMSDCELIARFTQLCKTCGNLANATRLWNWADNQPNSEIFWTILAELCAWSFSDPTDVNSLYFTYN